MKKTTILAMVVAAVVLPGSLVALVQEGWSKMTSKGGEVSLMVPQGWGLFDESDPLYRSAGDEIRKNNPGLSQQASSDQTALFVANYEAMGMENMNVVIQKGTSLPEAMYGQIAPVLEQQLPLKGKLESKVGDYPVGKALRYSGVIEVKTDESGGVVEVGVTGYMLSKNNNLYVVTFSAPAETAKSNRDLYEKMFKTFTINK